MNGFIFSSQFRVFPHGRKGMAEKEEYYLLLRWLYPVSHFIPEPQVRGRCNTYSTGQALPPQLSFSVNFLTFTLDVCFLSHTKYCAVDGEDIHHTENQYSHTHI